MNELRLPKEIAARARELSLKDDRLNTHDLGDAFDCALDSCYQAMLELAHSDEQVKGLVEALEKIADPKKRDHAEPDLYTRYGCVMHIAEEALTKFKESQYV